MPKFDISFRKKDDGSLDLSQLTVDLGDGKVQVTREEDGSVHASWEGETDTIKSVLNYLKDQFPNIRLPDIDLPGLS